MPWTLSNDEVWKKTHRLIQIGCGHYMALSFLFIGMEGCDL
ncbi:SdpI family protein [Mesobacillus jeotgali]|nr:SdpI family protein [Mesobacillus jeotgali]